MKNKMSFIVAAIFLVFFAASIWIYWYKAKKATDEIIRDDVIQLAQILNTIHQECVILSFEHQKNNIDFLNVISFEGSEVGPMNLKYPKKWQGAYLKDNPTIQEKYYQVIKAKDGYWVVPGDGVKLTNGLVIGRDIVFDETSSMPMLINTVLRYKNNPLAIRIMYEDQKHIDYSYDDSITRERLRNL